MKSVGLISGPTGGHLIPAYLVADKIHEKGGRPTLYTPPSDALELLPEFDFPRVDLSVEPWSGQSVLGKLHSLYSIVRQFLSLRKTMGDHDVLVSFGGYPAVPGLTAAWWLGRKVYFQEQNRLPGRTHRLFGGLEEDAFYGFPPAQVVPDDRVRVTGNPIRPAGDPENDWFRNEPLLVVFGGSQGSREVSRYLENCCRRLLDDGWHVYYLRGTFGNDLTGREWARRATFRQDQINRNLNRVLPQATCVWSRAGAGTLSELIHYGVPGLVFPFPHATDDHQTKNANWVSNHGPVTVFEPGTDPSPDVLIAHTKELGTSNGNYSVPWATDRLPQETIAERVLS